MNQTPVAIDATTSIPPHLDPGSALTDIPWVRTSEGLRTVREALLEAHETSGLDRVLNGIETGTHYRFLAAVAALVWRRKPGGKAFDPETIDAVLTELGPSTDLFHPEKPFLQTPGGGEVTDPVKKLHPWMPADRAENFWASSISPSKLGLPEAMLSLAVHYHYSFGGNSRVNGLKCLMGSPGIRYPGSGYTATELLWQGANLFETLQLNTPKAWVDGGGYPAWADPTCSRSKGAPGEPEHPLWRATWASNTAQASWVDGELIAVSIGGSSHLPPTMGAGKDAAKVWWDQRNTEDPFYLYADIETKNAAGVVTAVARKAQRLDLGHNETDLAVEWNSKGLSSAVRSRSEGMVKTPGRGAQLMFLRHLVEGTASSPVVRRTEVLVSSPKKWVVDEDRADAVSDAAKLVKAACADVTRPFTEKGRLTALRDRRGDTETAYWLKVSAPFEEFIIDGAGEEIDPTIWPRVRDAALAAFDEVTSTAPGPKLAPFIMTARNRVAWNLTQTLGLLQPKATQP